MLSKLNGNQTTYPGNPAASEVKRIKEQKGYSCVCMGHKAVSKKSLPLWRMWQKDVSGRLWSLLVCCVEHVGILHSRSRRCPKAPLLSQRCFTPYHYCGVILAGGSACLLIAGPSAWSCGFPARGLIAEDIQSLQVPMGRYGLETQALPPGSQLCA